MSKVVEVTSKEQLADLIENSPRLVVDFAAESWCGPCKALKPMYDAASEKVDAVLAHVDVDNHMDIAGQFNVMGVPTVLAFKDGKLLDEPIKARNVVALIEEISAL